MISADTKYAGFWIRFLANFIDDLVVNIAAMIPTVILTALLAKYGQINPGLVQIVGFMGFGLCIAFPYYTWGHYRWGTTVGKKLFGIYVISMKDRGPISIGQSILRTFGYIASYATFGCGFLMAAFHPEKRGLHDLIAGTVSVRR